MTWSLLPGKRHLVCSGSEAVHDIQPDWRGDLNASFGDRSYVLVQITDRAERALQRDSSTD